MRFRGRDCTCFRPCDSTFELPKMNWREERRLLNKCLAKHHLISERGQRVVTRTARTVKKRRNVEANRKWRKTHFCKYVGILRSQRKVRARKQQESPTPRFARIRAQHFAIEQFFLCQK